MLPANEIRNMNNYKQQRASQKPLDAANITSAAEVSYTLYKDMDKPSLMMQVSYSAGIVMTEEHYIHQAHLSSHTRNTEHTAYTSGREVLLHSCSVKIQHSSVTPNHILVFHSGGFSVAVTMFGINTVHC